MNDISIQKIKEHIENLTNEIKIHNENKPLCNLSNDILSKQLNELNEWKLQQNSEWLENPDALETILIEKIDCEQKLIKKYNDCIQNSIQKPTQISVKEYEEITKQMDAEIAEGKIPDPIHTNLMNAASLELGATPPPAPEPAAPPKPKTSEK